MTSFNPDTPDIMTAGGRLFEFLDPKPEQIDLDDIAHGLAMTCRFAGHCQSFYSVAQHSWLVSRWCDPEVAQHGLLHDAAEAYLVDMPRPIKRVLPEYRALEDHVQRIIYQRFGLAPETPADVKRVDARLLATEGRDICPQGWEFYKLPDPPFRISIGRCWGWEEAKDRFLERANDLRLA